MSGYGIATSTSLDVTAAEAAVRDALSAEGFGVLTEIDVAATLQAKLGIERAPYKILGACNPSLASRAIDAEEDIGLLLPCNVIVYAADDRTVVAAMEPMTMVELTSNDELQAVATEARDALERALGQLPS